MELGIQVSWLVLNLSQFCKHFSRIILIVDYATDVESKQLTSAEFAERGKAKQCKLHKLVNCTS